MSNTSDSARNNSLSEPLHFRFGFKMMNIISHSWGFYGRHLKYLMLPFQPIIDDPEVLENVRNRKYRYHYLFPLVLNGWILLDSLWIALTVGNTPRTPVLFFHLFQPHMPVFFLERANVSFPTVIGLSFISNLVLFFDPFPQVPFIMYQDQSKEQLSMPYRKGVLGRISDALAKKLIKFNRWYQKQIKVLVWFLGLQLNVGFTIPFIGMEIFKMISTSFEYFPNLRVIISLIACPFYFRTLVTSVHIGIQFMWQNYIIGLKQKHYLSAMDSRSELGGRTAYEMIVSFRKFYNWCRNTMAKILDLTREIEAYNRFYTMHITFTIILFGFSGCSVLNAVMQTKVEAPLIFTIVWVTFSSIFLWFIFLFSSSSSRTLYLNVKLFKKLRQSQVKLLSRRFLELGQMVKLDLVNEYKLLLQKCSFKMANSSMINNKLFAFQIFGAVSFFYMKLLAETKS